MPVIQPRICWFSSWICFPTLPQRFLHNPFQWWPSENQPFQSPISSCWGPRMPGSPALRWPRVQGGEGSAEHRPFRGDPSSLHGAAGGGSQVRGSHPTTVYTWCPSLIMSLAGESYTAHTASQPFITMLIFILNINQAIIYVFYVLCIYSGIFNCRQKVTYSLFILNKASIAIWKADIWAFCQH